MDRFPRVIVDVTQIMHLGMAVVTWRDAVVRFGCQNLIGFGLTVGASGLWKTGLEESATATAAEVIGFVGCHVNEVLFPNNGFDHVSKIISNGIPQRFSDQLTRILYSEFDLSFPVPLRTGFQLAFPDPLGVKLNDTHDFKVVLDIEFFQSCQDCE